MRIMINPEPPHEEFSWKHDCDSSEVDHDFQVGVCEMCGIREDDYVDHERADYLRDQAKLEELLVFFEERGK